MTKIKYFYVDNGGQGNTGREYHIHTGTSTSLLKGDIVGSYNICESESTCLCEYNLSGFSYLPLNVKKQKVRTELCIYYYISHRKYHFGPNYTRLVHTTICLKTCRLGGCVEKRVWIEKKKI